MFTPIVLPKLGVDIGDDIPYSLMLDSGASQYLSRSMVAPTLNKKWTLSFWFKRNANSVQHVVMGAYDGGSSSQAQIQFNTDDTFLSLYGGAVANSITTTGKWRDPTGWEHCCISNDATNTRSRIEINGVIVASSTSVPANVASQINSAITHYLGCSYLVGGFANVYLALVQFIDGQELYATNFGRVSADTGQWVNKTYTGVATLDTADFFAPLTTSLVLSKGTGSPTFTRATIATITDHEGVIRNCKSGEARFLGARRVGNLIQITSENFNDAIWTKINGGTGSIPTVTSGFADPLGGTGAWRLQANRGAGNAGTDYSILRGSATFPAGCMALRQCWIKSNTASAQDVYFGHPTATPVTVTTSWQLFLNISISATTAFDVGTVGTINSANSIDVLIFHPQAENVTGQSIQTAGEYVSVGVLSAPYHGANVDGVKYFSTTLSYYPTNLCLQSQSLTGWGATAVTVGSPTTAPDGTTTANCVFETAVTSQFVMTSAAMTKRAGAIITGSIYLKDNGSGTSKLYLAAGGYSAYCSAMCDPVAGTITLSNSLGYTNISGTVTLAANGFYRFTLTATTDSGTGVYLINNLGGAASYAGNATHGTYMWGAQIETVSALSSGPSYYIPTTGAIATGTTLRAGVPIPSSTLKGYLPEGARTNLCLQSNALGTSLPWAYGGTTPSPTQNVVGPDGATSAWTLTDNDVGATEFVFQDVVLTAASYTDSYFVKKTTGAQSSYPVIACYTGTTIALATIDTSNGVATLWTANTGRTMLAGASATCVNYNSDFWRVSLTYTATVATYSHMILPAATANATQSTGDFVATVTGSAVFYGAQHELGAFASTYIPTTTAAVPRNADVLTYPSSGNVLGTVGSAYAEVAYTPSTAVNRYIVDLSAPAGNRPCLWDASGGWSDLYDGTATRVLSALTVSPSGTKLVSAWGGAATQGAVNGVAGSAQGFDGDMNVGANIGIGGTSAVEAFGTIGNVRIWKRALSSAELSDITSASPSGVYLYGNNGFKLEFADPSFATYGLGKDTSGNGNHWTPQGGINSSNQVSDSPTCNWWTLHPLGNAKYAYSTSGNLQKGNLRMGPWVTSTSQVGPAIPPGKWQWEATLTNANYPLVGISTDDCQINADIAGGGTTGFWGIYYNGANYILENSTGITGVGSATNGQVARFAVDSTDPANIKFWASVAGNATQWVTRAGGTNGDPVAGTGTTVNTITGSKPIYPTAGLHVSGTVELNFGQRPFTYPMLTGYKQLCTANLVPVTDEVVTVSGTFTGNAAADGPFVFINGYPTTLTINSNAVTFGTHADRTAGGFKLRTASASYNASGSNTWTATIVSNRANCFKYANAKGNP